MGGTLYLVGTPIGNLGDLSRRARDTLASVGLVAAEDTRRTGRLLASAGVRAKMTSFFEGNERERTEELLELLREGLDVAVVTDGGMPGISDPGYRLVRSCADEQIEVRVIPGPSAVISALVVSGLPTNRFSFEGFLPRRQSDRARRLSSLALDTRTLVVFESPVRVQILLRDILDGLGDRRVAVVRELTKLHEEVLRGKASEVLARIADAELKGEVVVVIEGAPERSAHEIDGYLDEARELVAGGMRKRDAAHAVGDRHGVSANALYRALLSESATDTG